MELPIKHYTVSQKNAHGLTSCSNFRFCKSCRRALRFSALDSSEDFMGRSGLRFSLSLKGPFTLRTSTSVDVLIKRLV